jgi:hypothetical protein
VTVRGSWLVAIGVWACGPDEVDPVCAEIGEACHEAGEAAGEGSLAYECHELEEDTTLSADECEAKRADCEAACAAEGSD